MSAVLFVDSQVDKMFAIFVSSYRDYHQLPVQDQIAKDIFGADYPPVSELERLTQIALVSTHPSIIYAEPLPPNVIPVGGLQIKDPKPLPKVYLTFNCPAFIQLFLLHRISMISSLLAKMAQCSSHLARIF